jgi:endonuclease/exonuclease/phosphatase family metal-dependent hydrolase
MLKLLHLNIERDKHHARFTPFINSQNPHVVALQEVLEPDIPRLQASLGLPYVAYAPMLLHPADGNPRISGILLASRYPLGDIRLMPYFGTGDGRNLVDPAQPDAAMAFRFVLLFATIRHAGKGYRIGTTHFVWTPDGEADKHQRTAFATMMELLETENDFVLTGDFNAPRGKEIFTTLAAKYHDNVPPHYLCSLDKSLHRAGNHLPDYMVDGLFTTSGYSAEEVRLHNGVSDHLAITATIKPA